MATRSIVSRLTFVAGVLYLSYQLGACSSIPDEENLRSSLLANYNAKIKPAGKTTINITTYIGSLIYMDIAAQSMSVLLTLHMTWSDSRLAWNRTDYGNLTTIITPPEDIWTPPIVVENAIEDVGVLGGKNKDGVPLLISHLGDVAWLPPLVATTSCETLISNYPFDTQRCSVVLFGWTYPLSKMEIVPQFIDSTFLYSPNGEFVLTNTRTSIAYFGDPESEYTYKKIQLEFSFRRKWQFYTQNLLLPIMLNSILMNTVFLVPMETGEKLGYSLTVLLSYVVFLTWVTDRLPSVSTDTSILQVYLAIVLCLGCASTLLTIWVLRLYHTDAKKPVTPFYLTLATRILAPFSRRLHGRARNSVADQRRKKGRGNETEKDWNTYSSPKETDPSSESSLPAPRDERTESPGCLTSGDLFLVAGPAGRRDIGRAPEGNGDAREVTSHPAYTWPELAVLLDFFCFWVFASTLVVLTVAIVTLLYVNY